MEGVVRWPEEFEERYRRCGYWEDVPLGTRFDQWVARFGDRVAIAYQGKEVSYSQMGERVTRLARHLAEIGLKPYDRAVMQMFNVPELVYTFYACLKIGVIPICTLPTHRWAEIGYLAKATSARLHVIPGGEVKGFDYDEFARQMSRETPSLEHILTLDESKLPGAASVRRIVNEDSDLEAAEDVLASLSPDPSEPAIFQLSGGTTGTPKIIPRTHNDYYYNAKCVAEAYGLGENDRLLIPMPLMHNGPIINVLLPAHLLGACCVLTKSYAPESIMRAISLHRVTDMGAAVVLLHRLLEVPPDVRAKYDLSSMKQFWWSGNLNSEDQEKLHEMFHGADIGQNYGMAEGLICLTRKSDPPEAKKHTVGRPVSEADEVRLVDVNTGEEAALNEAGELWCRGPYTIRGYYNSAERNMEAFSPDGYYKTGDLLKKDEQGNYIWVGRIKDCISRGGEKINAEEVELCISGYPQVKEVAIVAMPDRSLEERVCAFVVPQPGETVTLESLNDFLLNQVGIAGFKAPERLELIDELPLTKVGKPDKKYLREVITETLKAEGKA